MDDNQFISVTLTSVGEYYDNLITVLDCKEEDDLTFNLIKSKLIAEYERKLVKSIENKENESESVFKIHTGATKKYCEFCKENGHNKKFCFKFSDWLSKKKERDRRPIKESVTMIIAEESDDGEEEFLF